MKIDTNEMYRVVTLYPTTGEPHRDIGYFPKLEDAKNFAYQYSRFSGTCDVYKDDQKVEID